MEINRTWNQNEAMPPARVMPGTSPSAPPVYARVAALPAGTVDHRVPVRRAAWEIRYVYYSAAHWKPITNGYSGAFPPRYKERVARLQRVDGRSRSRVAVACATPAPRTSSFTKRVCEVRRR